MLDDRYVLVGLREAGTAVDEGLRAAPAPATPAGSPRTEAPAPTA